MVVGLLGEKMNFKISNKSIGNSFPTFFIAEAGLNHNGDIDLAKKMIDNIIFSPRIKNVYLEVSRLNESAIRLYEKIGFRENGVRKKYYSNGADAILYKMELR